VHVVNQPQESAMDNVMQLAALRAPEVRDLRERVAGAVVVPGDEEWDAARRAWNLAVDQRPAVVAVPQTPGDVVEIVTWARDNGYRVAPQGTGHNAAALGDLADSVLVKLHELRGVTVDPAARVARAAAGTIWIEVVEAAAEHGLAALAGSSPDVGVVGYTLGGGLSFLARKHGIGANKVRAVEVVTADGELRRVDRENDPDLFWALRGGGGAFGVVTAIEIELIELREVYAGHLFFPVERAAEVLKAWRAWTDGLPDELTSVGRILQLPPLPDIPEPFRGKSFVVVQAIWAGDGLEEPNRLLQPMRALGPEIDTFDVMPIASLSRLHMDPEHPVPGVGDGGMLADVDDELVDAVVESVVGSPILGLEIRHLGGEVARPRPEHGAVASFDAPYLMFAVAIAPTPEAYAAGKAAVEAVAAAVEPWRAAHSYLNFHESESSQAFWTETALHRLRRVKAKYDPENVIRSNHELG
jgi:FAD/FMN-containing dehydrogenase